ncbi:MAG: protein kinase [Sandaracinaceae bacterium]
MEVAFEDELLGRTLGGTYRIEERLGAGGMGAVFRATHLRTSRSYAVKVLLPEVAVRRDAMKRFQREAEAVGALGHANVVAIHDFDVADGWAYLVMDLLEGEDLAARLRRVGRLSVEEATAIAVGIGAGLGAAHARGLVHRDLKPANVFLARQAGAPERPVLLDFGLAKSLAQDEALSQLTASGVVMGTPQYMSPEQASGLPLDARADLYSLATIYYEMLAGQTPFVAPTVPALFAKLATDPAPPIERHRPDVPPNVSYVLTRALEKMPDARYETAEAFVHALSTASTSVAPPMPAVSFPPTAHATPGPTPIGNAAASWPRGIDPHAPTQATPTSGARPMIATPQHATAAASRGTSPWLLVFAAGLFGAAVLGVAGGGYLYWLQVRQTRERLDAIAQSQPRGPSAEDVTRAIEDATRRQRELSAPPAPIDVPSTPEEPVVEATEPPAVEPAPVRTSRRRETSRRAPAAPAPASTPPAAPTPPVGSATGPPTAGPRPGVPETTDYMGRQDWAGCIREAHRHPRSAELLSARMNCAYQAHDDAELRSTCAELQQHYPQSGYNNACRSLMMVRGMGQ